jgi:hypothetical protein
MRPPCRNNSPPLATHYVNNHDLDVLHRADSDYAIFPATAVRYLEHWTIKNTYASRKSM